MPIFNNIPLYASLFISLFFEVFLLITYFESRESIKKEELSKTRLQTNNFPSVTIIIPCFNEEKTIAKTIFSLLKLRYPKNKLKILVVDDGSTDNTQKALDRFRKNKQVEIYKKENGGKYTVLNYGLEKVTTDLVGCLDADSFVDQFALQRIVNHFDDKETMAVTPAVMVHEPKNFLQSIQRVEYGWGVFLRKMLSYMNAIYITPGPFSIFRTKVFKNLGGYKHAHNTEDFEIAMRMQKNHYKIVNAHNAFVYTVTPHKFSLLYKQRLRWTYGFLNNVIDYRALLFKTEYGNIGMFILPIAVISIFTVVYFTGRVLWSAMFSLYEQIIKFQTIGFPLNTFKFDWFFMNTDSPLFIALVLMTISVVILVLSRRMSEGKFSFSMDLVYFLTIYSFMVPVWLIKAVYNTILRKKTSWR